MQISVKKLTTEDEMREACSDTLGGIPSKANLTRLYQAEHSVIRTQMFKVTMREIPTYVSVHFVRHHVGVDHFVKSNRKSRGGDGTEDRNTPVRHGMLCNAQALINMARKRLCKQSDPETVKVMHMIRAEVAHVDPSLAAHMNHDCIYRGDCFELKPCGYYKGHSKRQAKCLKYLKEMIEAGKIDMPSDQEIVKELGL